MTNDFLNTLKALFLPNIQFSRTKYLASITHPNQIDYHGTVRPFNVGSELFSPSNIGTEDKIVDEVVGMKNEDVILISLSGHYNQYNDLLEHSIKTYFDRVFKNMKLQQ